MADLGVGGLLNQLAISQWMIFSSSFLDLNFKGEGSTKSLDQIHTFIFFLRMSSLRKTKITSRDVGGALTPRDVPHLLLKDKHACVACVHA